MGSVLIVGASGILAPAASGLAARGETVTGVSRRGAMPDGVEALHVDARDATALAAVLDGRRWTAAIVYGPTVDEATLPLIARAVERLVLVRTSAAADPVRGELDVPAGVLQLGWQDDGDSVRWHTPVEVSAAALDVFDDGEPRILGMVRPWERRP